MAFHKPFAPLDPDDRWTPLKWRQWSRERDFDVWNPYFGHMMPCKPNWDYRFTPDEWNKISIPYLMRMGKELYGWWYKKNRYGSYDVTDDDPLWPLIPILPPTPPKGEQDD